MKTTVKEASQCPSCGKPTPAGALGGLCPACLLAQGAETDAGGGARFEPPPLAEVAKLFPQLEILDLLGAGGMGAVYKARQPALDRIVALKILPSQNARGVNFAERFNREARALARLSHPNIVAVHEFGQAGALSYFIMEFVDGANLRLLEQGSRLSPREALQIIPQICDALQYAHDEGVVHRDIKPENVLVDRKGRVKIADFGLAKILGVDAEALRLTAEGQVMGTPHYMAPEQIEKPLSVDHRADIYALGVVLYEMLTGDLPLGKFSPPSRKVQVDVRFDDVVLRALENDPARRYQKASEVKSQVETIADTPAQAAPAAPAPDKHYLRFAGFPLAVHRDGARVIHWKGAAHAFAVMFGILTVAFGFVSLFTGSSVMGWLGVIGLPSVVARLALAAVAVAWGIRFALQAKKESEPLPRTPQGTVILPPEKFSRKAVVAACWAPLFVLAALLYWTVSEVTMVPAGAAELPAPSTHWWQILLSVTLLPLGLMAPFGTTILGWIAAGDIRRARGRISGLPLAVFDGLFFPLLALDGFLIWAWVAIVDVLHAHAVFEPFHAGEVSVPTKLGAASLCVLVDLWIIRRVWRTVCLDGAAPVEPWWSSKKGAIAIGVACALIISAVGQRREKQHGISKNPPQVALRDAQTGRLVAKLPGGGTVELLAVGEPDTALNGWWSPAGTPLSNTLYEVRGAVENKSSRRVSKDLLFRAIDLPEGASSCGAEAQPASGIGSGGEVFLNDRKVRGGYQARMGWEPSVRSASVRLGYGLEPWRTIATQSATSQSHQQVRQLNDPNWTVNFHHSPADTGDGAQMAVVFGPEDRMWEHRMVAVDTNGVEHTASMSDGTPVEKLTLWTHTFRGLTLREVKEFRLQVRPVYWIEFRDVALAPNAPLPEPRRAQFGPAREVTFDEIIDFDTGVATNFPPDRGGPNPFQNYPNLVWMRQHGFDAGAGIGELWPVDMDFVVLDLSDWDELPVSGLVQRIYQNHFRPGQLKALADGRLPATYGFRTREGNIGILQLVAFAEGKPSATVRYKLRQSEVVSAQARSPSSQPEEAREPEAVSSYSGTDAALSDPPRLRFLAWQEEWKTNQPAGAWHPDGSPVTDGAEMDLLRNAPASGMDVSKTEAAKRHPHFLHLWFSHPLFNLQGLNSVTLFDADGALLKLGADGAISSGVRSPSERRENVGWLAATLSPGEGARIPSTVAVRLRYAIGPMEGQQEVASDFEGSMSLEGNSQLNGIGQGAGGRAFVSIAVDTRKNESRHFGVVAITRDGRELVDSGRSSAGNVGSGVRVEKFEFNTPLADVARFRIGTRPIRTMEWTNVILLKSTH